MLTAYGYGVRVRGMTNRLRSWTQAEEDALRAVLATGVPAHQAVIVAVINAIPDEAWVQVAIDRGVLRETDVDWNGKPFDVDTRKNIASDVTLYRMDGPR
jgi:hypothetical protein